MQGPGLFQRSQHDQLVRIALQTARQTDPPRKRGAQPSDDRLGSTWTTRAAFGGASQSRGARLRPRTVAQFAAAKAGLILVTLKMLPATEPAPGTNAASNRTARRGVFADSRRPTACRRRAAPVARPRSPDRAALRSQSALRRTDADAPPWQSGQRRCPRSADRAPMPRDRRPAAQPPRSGSMTALPRHQSAPPRAGDRSARRAAAGPDESAARAAPWPDRSTG